MNWGKGQIQLILNHPSQEPKAKGTWAVSMTGGDGGF